MNVLMDSSATSVLDRFEDVTERIEVEETPVERLSSVTSLDVKTEVLARLSRRGHDWSGVLGSNRRKK